MLNRVSRNVFSIVGATAGVGNGLINQDLAMADSNDMHAATSPSTHQKQRDETDFPRILNLSVDNAPELVDSLDNCRAALTNILPPSSELRERDVDIVLKNLDSILPQNSPLSSCERIHNAVKSVLLNKNFMRRISNDLAHSGDSHDHMPEEYVFVEPENDRNVETYQENTLVPETHQENTLAPVSFPSDDWLRASLGNSCGLCHDILAVPHITNCSHSFCGICITEHEERCTLANPSAADGDVEIVNRCPVCDAQITERIYERTLDHAMMGLVDRLEDCVEKEAWRERVESFHTLLLSREYQEHGGVLGGEGERGGYSSYFWSLVLTISVVVVTILVTFVRRG